MYTQDDNVIIQSYCTAALISELNRNEFLASRFFAEMDFSESLARQVIEAVGLENQGFFLIALYAMLVIPRQLIADKYQREYKDLNRFLAETVSYIATDYPEDKTHVNYLRHVRNSVAHAGVKFDPSSHIAFLDANRRGNTFEAHLPIKKCSDFFFAVQKVHIRYISDRKRELGQS